MSPDDGTRLKELEKHILTDHSGNIYKKYEGIFDLRPKKEIRDKIDIILKNQESFRDYPFGTKLEPMFENQYETDDIKKNNLLQFIPPTCEENEYYVLDHGCGKASMLKMLEALGYNYVGADISSENFLKKNKKPKGIIFKADLHRLPFQDNTFHFCFSYSVFEHLQNPFLAAKELYRIMKPGSTCFVAVANLVPFHMDSFFHFTHFGTLNLFRSVGFEVLQVAGSSWNGYEAISSMDGLPGPKSIRIILSRLIYLCHKSLWRIRSIVKRRDFEKDEMLRHSMMAGLIKTIIKKPTE